MYICIWVCARVSADTYCVQKRALFMIIRLLSFAKPEIKVCAQSLPDPKICLSSLAGSFQFLCYCFLALLELFSGLNWYKFWRRPLKTPIMFLRCCGNPDPYEGSKVPSVTSRKRRAGKMAQSVKGLLQKCWGPSLIPQTFIGLKYHHW